MRVLRVYHAALEPGHDQRDLALARAGLSLSLAAPRDWPGGVNARDDVSVFDVRRPGDVNRHTYVSPSKIAAIAADVDLVDLHEEPFSAVTHQLLSALPAHLPVVTYTAQNIDKRWPPPFHQWQRSAFDRISGIYPCSRQAASVARGAGFGGLITPLPLGTDTAMFFPGTLAHDADEFVLGLVGRLVPEKGIADVLAALSAVAAVRPARLLVIGDGPETSTIAGYDGPGAVELIPWSTPAEVASRYREMHLVVVPSKATRTWVEQFGRVVTEGRACGAVAVGYASGSLPEVIGSSGITVAAGDVTGLAAACRALAEDGSRWETLRALGISDTSSWDDVAHAQLEFYAAATAGPPRSVATHAAAVEEFGPPALISGGGRPFALPVLREDTALARGAAGLVDAASALRVSPAERAVERLLLAAVRLPADPGFELACADAARCVSTGRVITLARDHGVLPLLAQAVTDSGSWPELSAAIREPFLGHVGQTMVLQVETAAVIEGLADLPYALVKGPVLAGHAYGNLERRAFADLDLVVGHSDVVAAATAIGAAGITAAGVSSAASRGAGQVSGLLPRGTSLDLHWELINDPAVRRDFSFPVAPALARRRTVSLEGQPVSTLDATDTLLHLASHTAVSGGHRLIWYVDIDRTVRVDGIDVSLLVSRARAAKLSTTVAVLLRRCVRQLGTPVPAGVIEALLADGSRAWGAVGLPFDALVPLSSSPSRPSHGQVYYRATRLTLPSSVRALTGLAAEIRRAAG